MHKFRRNIPVKRWVSIASLLLLLQGVFPVIAYCADDVITVRDAWIREAPPNAVSLAGYMVIENPSDSEQSLVSATSDVFGMVTIHRTAHEGGMARMHHQKMVSIPARAEVVFKPGSYHLMLVEPRRALRAGDKVVVNLFFANGSKPSITFDVRKGMPMKKGKGGMKCGGRQSR